ncbi:Glucose dehydrogenase [Sphingomonas antarctica]|uniref:PQQ-dependent sugar dehydrogenase n=1 Tax=Sphingomonas antarctica TaxID=2040274 RepID=UPI0039E9FAA5
MRFLLALVALIAAPATAKPTYVAAGTCDGLPRVQLTTPRGICVGLVAEHLGFPRGLALIGRDVYLADLASRTPGHGRILRLGDYGRAAPVVVLSGLNQPNGLAATADGKLYVGEVGRIIRFDPRAPNPQATISVMVSGLPTDGRHNLTAFILAPDGALIIGSGARSDNCETDAGRLPNPAALCPETRERPPRGSLLRLDPTTVRPASAASLPPFATGIRNAMAYAFAPDGTLIAASNGRDNIDSADKRLSDDALPHDVLLKIVRGGDYGWPYCFDAGRPSPEYPRFDCRTRRAPAMLLSPHAAPLSMIRYRGTRLKVLTGKLILGYHGYRARGHRIVAIALDGLAPVGGEVDVVSGWATREGVHPQGFPSALLELPDGSILIAEDQNRTLLRLSTP